jgi:hypothetical protein
VGECGCREYFTGVFYDREQQREIIRRSIDYPYWPVVSEDERVRFVIDALQFFMPTFRNGDSTVSRRRRHGSAGNRPRRGRQGTSHRQRELSGGTVRVLGAARLTVDLASLYRRKSS